MSICNWKNEFILALGRNESVIVNDNFYSKKMTRFNLLIWTSWYLQNHNPTSVLVSLWLEFVKIIVADVW